jgi:2-dehydro-3-deoxyphosphooctonate aldolase (KDO 8-P synthase)
VDKKNVVAKITQFRQRQCGSLERGVVRLQHAGFGLAVAVCLAIGLAPSCSGSTLEGGPTGEGGSTGGDRRFVETLARAAVAVGVAGVFIETHQDPDNAPSDGPNMVPLKDLPVLLERLMAFDRVAKNAG